MAETIRLLHTEYRTDTETLRRVAAGIRALPDHRSRQPTAADIARLRGEFDRVVARWRATGREELGRGEW